MITVSNLPLQFGNYNLYLVSKFKNKKNEKNTLNFRSIIFNFLSKFI